MPEKSTQQETLAGQAQPPCFLEATSDEPDQAPTVLINVGGGPINYIEVKSQMAGNERCRVVFNNGSDYHLDGKRAGSFLRSVREAGLWVPPAEIVGAAGSSRR